jgi:hypothetical protein
MFDLKHIRAILRDPTLRKELLKDKNIPLEAYIKFDQQTEEMRDEIIENIDGVLQAFAPVQICYPSPYDNLPDDAWIYGAKGVYVVSNQDGNILFTRKIDAFKYANEISAVSSDIAKILI